MEQNRVEYLHCLKPIHEALADGRVLLTARAGGGKPNSMAIGWGCPGIIWARPVFIVLVRPSRFTYGIIEECGDFTVNVAPPALKDVVTWCGTVSGRDHDKFAEKGLTALNASTVGSPLIAECLINIECRVVHRNDLIPAELASSVTKDFYPRGDFHRCYFGEVVACWGAAG